MAHPMGRGRRCFSAPIVAPIDRRPVDAACRSMRRTYDRAATHSPGSGSADLSQGCGACRMIEDKPHLRRILQSILQYQSIDSYGILDNAVGYVG
jgi:hypothetical protein